MNKKIAMSPKRFLLVILLFPALLFAGQSNSSGVRSTESASLRTGRGMRAKPAAEAMGEIRRNISEALTVIEDNYAAGDKLEYNELFKSSIDGMLHTLDPHSNYFDRKEFEDFLTQQRSEYFGIGATIGDLRMDGAVNTYIRATFENAPASRAGLRFGDRIAEVDGQSMAGKPFFEVRKFLLGPRGSAVKVTVERALTGKLETFSITRDAVPQPSVPQAYMLRPGIGYIAVTGGFNLTTADEFRGALGKLRALDMQMLVMDLRGNGGGLVNQAVSIANTFLARGQLILTQKGRVDGSSQTFRSDNDSPDETPLVLIVNQGTASASEILAGALQDHDRALIVGETSFGKGLVQAPFQLSYGSALLLTIAKYFTPSGRLIQRDYSNGGLYDYYAKRSPEGSDQQAGRSGETEKANHTDTGRTVYGGGGITPDETVKALLISPEEQPLFDPVFAFARELSLGRVKGFETYAVPNSIEYDHDLKPADFPITDSLFAAFKKFATSTSSFKVSPAVLEREQPFLQKLLRYDLVTAAYGATGALQVFNASDPQIAKAAELLPRARALANAASRAHRPS